MRKKFLVVGMVLILFLNVILVGSVNAENKTVRVYTEGRCPDLLKYNGYIVGCVRVSYYDGYLEYPAYCIDRDLPGIGTGVGEKDFYTVEIQDNMNNTQLWRVISNSYPYKSLDELGVNSIEEAFVATKQAVYCILYGNNPNDYSGIGEAGERTLKLLKKLVSDAKNSNSSKPSKVIDIITDNTTWNIDDLENKYISKTYYISTDAEYEKYEVHINSDELPEGSRITDLNNVSKSVFLKNEKFKILIPVNHNKSENKFNINISAMLKTNPVFFGKAPEGLQSYALGAYAYEEGKGVLEDIFMKNNSKVTIIKKDGNTDEFLQGTEFNILDRNKSIVYSNLITNEKGEIIIDGIEPGKYYLQETKASAGYVKLDKLVEFDMELNKEIKITVNNNKIEKSEINSDKEEININIENSENNINIKEDETNINDSNKENNINIETNKTDINKNNEENNINIEQSISTIKKLPKTGF